MRLSPTWTSLVARSVAFAALATVLVLGTALLRGEAASPRLGELGLLAFVAGLCAGAFGFAAIHFVLGRRGKAARFAAAAILAGPGFAGSLYLAFAALSRLVVNPPDPSIVEEYGLFHVVLGTLIDVLGAFVVTGAKYLLPWTLPLLSLAAGLLAARPARVEKLRHAWYRRGFPARESP